MALMDADAAEDPAFEARVIRSFIRDGRLTTIPAQEKKRFVLLRWLRDRVFTEDREYPEKEVNQRLAVYHPDLASLRRYMVEAGLASRAAACTDARMTLRSAEPDPPRPPSRRVYSPPSIGSIMPSPRRRAGRGRRCVPSRH